MYTVQRCRWLDLPTPSFHRGDHNELEMPHRAARCAHAPHASPLGAAVVGSGPRTPGFIVNHGRQFLSTQCSALTELIKSFLKKDALFRYPLATLHFSWEQPQQLLTHPPVSEQSVKNLLIVLEYHLWLLTYLQQHQ